MTMNESYFWEVYIDDPRVPNPETFGYCKKCGKPLSESDLMFAFEIAELFNLDDDIFDHLCKECCSR